MELMSYENEPTATNPYNQQPKKESTLIESMELRTSCERALGNDKWGAIIIQHFNDMKTVQPELWLVELLDGQAKVNVTNYLTLLRAVKHAIQTRKKKLRPAA